MSKKIYVGNLGYSVAEADLTEKFAEFGTVESAKIIIDRDTNRSKGFAFVEMSSPSEAADAISALNGTEFAGRAMNVALYFAVHSRKRVIASAGAMPLSLARANESRLVFTSSPIGLISASKVSRTPRWREPTAAPSSVMECRP